ncbi:MAG: choice-of-anchor J domain-containing protein [Duncaniella sp.]|nr:choice-of-anchor J domain-containing protein [Duncaniella sp.]
MKKVLHTLTLGVGLAISIAAPAHADSKVTVGELPLTTSATHGKRPAVKAKKTARDHARMQQTSPKLRLTNTRPVTSAPMSREAGQDIPVIYGNVIDSYELFDMGLYQLPQSDDSEFTLLLADIEGERGGVALGGVYYVTTDDWDCGTVRGYSLESGDVVYEAEVPAEQVPIALCLNPADNRLYGIFNPEDYGDDYVWANIDYSSETPEFTPLGTLPEGVYTALSCDAMGNMYVLRDLENEYYEIYDSEFLKVDSGTGELTLVGNVGYFSEYDTSGCIDPATGRMFYAMCTFDACGLVEIDVHTGSGTLLLDFPDMEEIVGMYCPVAEVSAKAPAMVENLELLFPQGNLSGKVAFTAPALLSDGSEAEGEMDYHVICGDVEVSGSVMPGASAEAAFTLPQAGRYTFRVYLSNEAGDGAAALVEEFIGEDIPAMPSVFTAGYADGSMTLAWDEAVTGASGGYIDAEKISYRLVQTSPEEKVIEEATKANSATLDFEAPEEKTVYAYTLAMSYDGDEIGVMESNAVVLGSLLPPYVQNFADAEAMDDFTILDSNADEYTWKFFGNSVRIESNQAAASDDWLILPAIKLTEGKNYVVSWRAWCQSVACPEKLEVMIGTAPTAEAMTTSLKEPAVIATLQEGAETSEAKFTPSATGLYYIGFHALSDADSFYLYLSDLSVTQGAEAAAPSAAADFKVTPDALGNPVATIALTVPTTYVNGEPMDAPDAVKVMCGDEVIKTVEQPAAGTVVSFAHTLEACGDYTFTAIVEKAGMESAPVSQSVYCGPGMPGAVTGVTLTEVGNTGEVVLKWDAVAVNHLGDAINPDLVKYNVFRIDNQTVVETVASNFSGTEMSLAPEFDEAQDFVRYAVYGVTDKGQGVGMQSDMIPVGEPYSDFAESFAGGELTHVFGVNTINEGLLGVYTDSQLEGVNSHDADNGFMLFYGQQAGQGVELSSGKISIADMEQPVLELYLRNFGEDDKNLFEVEVRAPGEDYVSRLSTTPPAVGTDEWNLVSIPLSEVKSPVMQFRLRALINNYGSVGIDNMKVYDAKSTALVTPADALLRVTTSKGAIRIEGGEGIMAQLSNVAGVSRTIELTGDVTVAVAPGVYIIAAESETVKVMVP